MEISTDDKYLYIKFSTIEKIFGIHKSFIIPLMDILNANTKDPCQSFREIKAPGSFFPGLIKAGTYFTDRGREFWYVTRKHTFLTLELKKGFYRRIILSIDENEKIKKKINKSL